eukprot:TRINITY_DN163_c0_g2_i1.p1 TRINITY_DN163_c0_g2~~TRINITY_DN163_c0_g2_i1.p1  ORF type:complete len:305 (-),score=37.40 TRINITY_DN163_c0_g2_i1:157-1071(-)
MTAALTSLISVNAIAAVAVSNGGQHVHAQPFSRILVKSRNHRRDDLLLDFCNSLFRQCGAWRMKTGGSCCRRQPKMTGCSYKSVGETTLFGKAAEEPTSTMLPIDLLKDSPRAAPQENETFAEPSPEPSRRDRAMAQYESLKADLFRLTRGTALACTVYALLTVSLKAAASYGLGALGSWLYLQLLASHVDKISREDVPEVFRRRRYKRIGVDSRTLSEAFERGVEAIGFSLGNVRLLVPVGLMLLGCFSQSETAEKGLHLQTVPLMLGFFAYKGAVLIQTLQDNKDLLLEWGDDEDSDDQKMY